jgi:hypothetical protein
MLRYCKVSKNVQFIQNLSNIAKFAIKIPKNPTFVKNPTELFGKSETLTFK